jgi:hypothetical protein
MQACDRAKTSAQAVAILLAESGLMVMAAAHALESGPDAKGADGVSNLDRLLSYSADVSAAINKLHALAKSERSPIIKPPGALQ